MKKQQRKEVKCSCLCVWFIVLLSASNIGRNHSANVGKQWSGVMGDLKNGGTAAI